MHELLAVCLLSVDRDSLEVDANQASSSGSSSQAVMLEAMRTTLDRRWVEHDSYGLFQELMRGAKAFYEWRAEEGPVRLLFTVTGVCFEIDVLADQSAKCTGCADHTPLSAAPQLAPPAY